MSSYPCKYLSTRKCCCCFNCDPRQVFLILSSTCLLLGLINMCSYPLCPAIIISSLVLAFYYFGAGIYLLYAVTGVHEKLLKAFPWLMLFSYIPIAAYVGCLVASLECIQKWTTHYSLDENADYAKNMFIGIISLYSMFAVVDFLFSTYALMLSMGQFEDKTSSGLLTTGAIPPQNPYGGPFPPQSTQLAFSALTTTAGAAADAASTTAATITAPASQEEVTDALASGPPSQTSQQNSDLNEEVF